MRDDLRDEKYFVVKYEQPGESPGFFLVGPHGGRVLGQRNDLSALVSYANGCGIPQEKISKSVPLSVLDDMRKNYAGGHHIHRV